MMKKAVFLWMIVLGFASCKNERHQESDLDIFERKVKTGNRQCFLYVSGKDSIKLSIQENHNHANGRLEFRMFEKDNSDGTLSGTFIGDTLFVNYTFRSEGTTSVREMAFLRRGRELIVGSGNLENLGDREVFSDDGSVTFDTGVVLRAVACK